MSKERFMDFLNEIAYGKDEWQYAKTKLNQEGEKA